VAPEAELFDASGKKVGKHYAGPTWESIEDGSKVVGTVKSRADAPAPDAIPWLLLSATESSTGGMLGGVKSIQRIDTRGGKPPAGTCAAGEVAKVLYTAAYWSRARGGSPRGTSGPLRWLKRSKSGHVLGYRRLSWRR
jgi:hypothetical protein